MNPNPSVPRVHTNHLAGGASSSLDGKVCFNKPNVHHHFHGHDSGTNSLEVPTIYEAHVRWYISNIWPYMVQYLLDFPFKSFSEWLSAVITGGDGASMIYRKACRYCVKGSLSWAPSNDSQLCRPSFSTWRPTKYQKQVITWATNRMATAELMMATTNMIHLQRGLKKKNIWRVQKALESHGCCFHEQANCQTYGYKYIYIYMDK